MENQKEILTRVTENRIIVEAILAVLLWSGNLIFLPKELAGKIISTENVEYPYAAFFFGLVFLAGCSYFLAAWLLHIVLATAKLYHMNIKTVRQKISFKKVAFAIARFLHRMLVAIRVIKKNESGS